VTKDIQELYCDTRLGGLKRWYYRKPDDANMFVPEQIPKCVCFLAVKAQSEYGEYDHFIGTAFFVGMPFQSGHYLYLVTARHTVREAKAQGYSEFFVRLNTLSGKSEVIPIPDEWVYPENEAIDVAVLPFNATFDGSKNEDFDHATVGVNNKRHRHRFG
jgi:hypothetical protein